MWTLPWSLRPPHLEPEQWLSCNHRYKNEVHERLKAKDAAGFAAQERRRADYARFKTMGKVAMVAVAMPALSCKGFLDGPNETFYNSYEDEPCWHNTPSP